MQQYIGIVRQWDRYLIPQYVCLVFSYSCSLTLPYLTLGVGRLLHLPSAEAVSVRPNAQPQCNQKVTVIGCEAQQITSHLGLVTCSMVVPIRWSALG